MWYISNKKLRQYFEIAPFSHNKSRKYTYTNIYIEIDPFLTNENQTHFKTLN